ncbi:S41 family peptidase [Bacillus aquiflavi]|uniref:C-terminal processing peptidase n=2 Tax=Bacilli TaxID=91061 RepID=A0A6B3VYI3_9BACI|nr:S41 family peptidase [Bacillus aquiflavi]MBA4537745.1 S41 family peptidase [Bacillus aquiflavi]NEY82002.1 S41 family peptidase [Bacillus aquiflavi]UAC50034.1 S41 family peptidase [Bacillus aquiflavi]
MKRFQFAVLLFFIVLVTAGITTSVFVFGNGKNVLKERSEFEKLYTAYDTLNKEYYKKVDPEKVVNGAINGMFDSLDDPYSDYMDKEEAASFHENISSSFEGIGAEIQELEGHIIIVSPIKGSPAEKSGLQPNDKILAVDGKSIQGMNASEAVTHIRGEKGTKVKLTIQREGVEETLNIEIVRDTIPIETVYGEMLEDGIAKVQITSFSTNTTKELLTALNDLQQEGMKGLILDLRQNPGGLLPQAIEISSLFVPDGEILFKVEDRAGNIEEYKSSNNNNSDTPLVVLIDKGSASASEILAAAVKESANVPLIGEKSFGKGTVQTAQDFDDGSNMKFTTSKWLTPKGNWIHEKGIKPDYEVSLPEYASLPYISPDKELKVSSSSNEVKTAQEMLTVLGYDPGRKDGFFDDKTKEAVIAFQKDTQLEANGVLKGESTIKLMELVRQHIEKNDTQIQKAVEVLKTLIDA